MKCNLFSAKLLLVALIAALQLQYASAQVTFSYWVHPPGITLYASAPAMYGVGTSSNIAIDDIYSSVVNIGFTFNYYGNNYTQCVIGANGKISFGTSNAGLYDPWTINAALAGNSGALNCICGPYCDMDIVYGGQITYFTAGTAPNRIFVATFCHDAMFSCTAQNTTTQIILYETLNTAEVHIGHKDTCVSWNGGYAIVGVQNATGTASTAAPGRDYPSVWTASNEAWSFTPDGTFSSYSVNSIPYSPSPYYTIYWYDSTTGAFLGSGDSLVIDTATAGNFKAVAVSCSDTSSTGLDSVATGYLRLFNLAVDQVSSVKEFSVYPNPADNILNIKANDIIYSVVVTNLLGQIVLEQRASDKHTQIDISQLPPSVYLIKVNGTVVRRFVKE